MIKYHYPVQLLLIILVLVCKVLKLHLIECGFVILYLINAFNRFDSDVSE